MNIWKSQLVFLSAVLLLPLLCCSCITGTADSFCEQFHETVSFQERRFTWSEDGEVLTVFSKKKLEYCRWWFGIQNGSIETTRTHAYPLKEPEPGAKCGHFTLIPSPKGTFLNPSSNVLVVDHIQNHPYQVDYNYMRLPELSLQSVRSIGKLKLNKNKFTIHPDAMAYFQKPFLVYNPENPRYEFVIPYKIENNICHYYIPKDSLELTAHHIYEHSTSRIVLTTLLFPPAILLDIVTSPIQACIFASEIFGVVFGKKRIYK